MGASGSRIQGIVFHKMAMPLVIKLPRRDGMGKNTFCCRTE